MSDSEERIERVLAGLREADAPVGMEARILRAMEERAAREPRRFWGGMRQPAFAMAGVCAVVLLAALAVSSMRRQAGVVLSHEVATLASLHAADRADGVPQRRKPLVDLDGNGTAEAVPLGTTGMSSTPGLPRRTRLFRGGRETVAGEVSVAAGDSSEILPADQEALAVSEMLAPSKPAPPLPLTRQEKMLAQVVRKGEPEELATLRRDVREKQMEMGKAEYQNFFEPPPVKDNE